MFRGIFASTHVFEMTCFWIFPNSKNFPQIFKTFPKDQGVTQWLDKHQGSFTIVLWGTVQTTLTTPWDQITIFITSILKTQVIPAVWLAHSSVIYSRIALSNQSNWMKNVLASVTLDWVFDRLLQYWNVKAFPVPLFSKKAATRSIKYWHFTNKKKCISTMKLWDFQTGCNKVVIALRVVQFWSEIICVICD